MGCNSKLTYLSAYCVQQRWPAMLIDSGQGEQVRAVKTLAQSMSQSVTEIYMSSQSDVGDLLGSFEIVKGNLAEDQTETKRLSEMDR